jgi:hypothetical protein
LFNTYEIQIRIEVWSIDYQQKGEAAPDIEALVCVKPPQESTRLLTIAASATTTS